MIISLEGDRSWHVACAQFWDIIREQAPALCDAVVEGYAIHPEDLKRAVNPELLDDITPNVTGVTAARIGFKVS